MKITTRLILSFLLVSVIPLALLGYLGLRAMDSMRSLAVDKSTQALRELGEAAIHQKAVDVARPIKDLHVTVLQLLGLDDNKLTYFHEGRFKQLSQTGGAVIEELLA